MSSKNKFLIKLNLVLLTFFLVFPKNILAQVVINEVSSDGNSDWVELYSSEDINISSWILDDDGTSSNLKVFEEGTIIGPSNQFIVIDVSNRLNDAGDIITLYSSDNTIINQLSYGNKGGVCLPNSDQSVGRVDNGNTIERFNISTRNQTNNWATLAVCPTPTPSPSPTPSPTNSPTQAPTAMPKTATPKPISTKTSSPKPTPTPTSEAEVTSEPENIIGDIKIVETTPQGMVAGSKTTNIKSFISFVFISLGIVFLGFAGFNIYKNIKSEYNNKTDENSSQKSS